jgi:hypothetical protein
MLAARPGAFTGTSENARMANMLRDEGIDVTTGQATRSQPLMRAEGMLAATDQQVEDFTAAAMKMLGSTERLATPENLANIEKTLVKQMDDAVAGVSVVPTAGHGAAALTIAREYAERVPAGQLTPRIRGIANEVISLAKNGKDVPLSKLREWRSDIGALAVSPDAATREAAHGLRKALDAMTDTALQAAGRTEDIASLAAARESYRNFIAVRDAASRAGAETGVLSPTALNQSMIRTMGREAYATGRATPMTEFTRAGAATLRSAPATLAGGARSIVEAVPAALAAAGATAAYGGGIGPAGVAFSAGLGFAAPSVGQALMRSPAMQAILRDPRGVLGQSARNLSPALASQAVGTPQ